MSRDALYDGSPLPYAKGPRPHTGSVPGANLRSSRSGLVVLDTPEHSSPCQGYPYSHVYRTSSNPNLNVTVTIDHRGQASAHQLNQVPLEFEEQIGGTTEAPTDLPPEAALFLLTNNAAVGSADTRVSPNEIALPLVPKEGTKTRPVGSSKTKAAAQGRRRHPSAYLCIHPGCNSEFTSITRARSHVHAHCDFKQFICSCRAAFTTSSVLNRHIKSQGPRHCKVESTPSLEETDVVDRAIARYLRQIKDDGTLAPLKT